jgi:hypothetical protein
MNRLKHQPKKIEIIKSNFCFITFYLIEFAGYHAEKQEASDSQSTVSVTSTWF